MSEEKKYLDVTGLHIKPGHHVFEIDHVSKAIVKAEYAELSHEGEKRMFLVVKPGCDYEAALNIKNAIKKFNKGK